jgi:hypothetical protein
VRSYFRELKRARPQATAACGCRLGPPRSARALSHASTGRWGNPARDPICYNLCLPPERE